MAKEVELVMRNATKGLEDQIAGFDSWVSNAGDFNYENALQSVSKKYSGKYRQVISQASDEIYTKFIQGFDSLLPSMVQDNLERLGERKIYAYQANLIGEDKDRRFINGVEAEIHRRAVILKRNKLVRTFKQAQKEAINQLVRKGILKCEGDPFEVISDPYVLSAEDILTEVLGEVVYDFLQQKFPDQIGMSSARDISTSMTGRSRKKLRSYTK